MQTLLTPPLSSYWWAARTWAWSHLTLSVCRHEFPDLRTSRQSLQVEANGATDRSVGKTSIAAAAGGEWVSLPEVRPHLTADRSQGNGPRNWGAATNWAVSLSAGLSRCRQLEPPRMKHWPPRIHAGWTRDCVGKWCFF